MEISASRQSSDRTFPFWRSLAAANNFVDQTAKKKEYKINKQKEKKQWNHCSVQSHCCNVFYGDACISLTAHSMNSFFILKEVFDKKYTGSIYNANYI